LSPAPAVAQERGLKATSPRPEGERNEQSRRKKRAVAMEEEKGCGRNSYMDVSAHLCPTLPPNCTPRR